MAEGDETAAEGPGGGSDALRRLEQRLDRAAQAAERLLGDAAAAAGAGHSADREAAANGQAAEGGASAGGAGHFEGPSPIPEAGWQRAGERSRNEDELELLLGVVAAVRDRIPPELQRRLAEAIRELLLAVRALIDWYLERTERRRAEPATVQDIPIL
jgi:hypothetical protein